MPAGDVTDRLLEPRSLRVESLAAVVAGSVVRPTKLEDRAEEALVRGLVDRPDLGLVAVFGVDVEGDAARVVRGVLDPGGSLTPVLLDVDRALDHDAAQLTRGQFGFDLEVADELGEVVAHPSFTSQLRRRAVRCEPARV
jgi:hypothetical protein